MSEKAYTKTNFFYIDESGGILNDSPAFILGCTRTDTPIIVKETIECLLKSFEDELYFSVMIDEIREQGFHAVDNHPDVRAAFFKILPTLNFRSFICILNKSCSPYREWIAQGEETKIYLTALHKILEGRFNNREDESEFLFEELQLKDSQQKILENYFEPFQKKGNVRFQIVGKEEVNLALTDYMNYVIHSIISAKDLAKVKRMVDNLELLKPKIAFVNILHNDRFLTRKDNYNAEKIVQLYNG